MNNLSQLQDLFQQEFQDTGLKRGAYLAPGRVNLIGEHTDYNDGFVLPMAIEKEVVVLAQLRKDELVEVYSLDYQKKLSFSLAQLEYESEHTWVNYVKGVIAELQKAGYQLQGVNLLFTGNVPQGAGLSSSAALEVATAYALADLNNLDISPVEMALLCQRAENNFVGVNCGIMDQYISRLGKKDHALMIDCRSKEYELVPFQNADYEIVIINSQVARGLVDSEYNQRRLECQEATAFFAQNLERRVAALRDVSMEELTYFAEQLPLKVRQRARHVISENKRVLTAMGALRQNDLETFGRLMIESHESLSKDYEVSCPELDLLVKLALQEAGVLGARMTGAGFGGCTVNLVAKEKIEGFIAQVNRKYQEKTGLEPDFYVSSPAEGAHKLEEKAVK